jgi:hypothetical protein
MSEGLIFSFGRLMQQFGIQYVVKLFPRAESNELRARGMSLPEILDELRVCGKWPPASIPGIRVTASAREGQPTRLSDSGVEYIVTDHDPKALLPGETLMAILKDLIHAAECGCMGCQYRVDSRLRHYREETKPSPNRYPNR